jgi:hypothetical protein
MHPTWRQQVGCHVFGVLLLSCNARIADIGKSSFFLLRKVSVYSTCVHNFQGIGTAACLLSLLTLF